ncbi:hypothetical protein [Variovorax sp.]|jgi:hypothetical protein|uniref:hypothetical protein n=1 Tax=Variovorax sp. TaxID=1871043 RepID=UPI0025F6F2DB|nr:hypothetical protein [Variovorax sp.]
MISFIDHGSWRRPTPRTLWRTACLADSQKSYIDLAGPRVETMTQEFGMTTIAFDKRYEAWAAAEAAVYEAMIRLGPLGHAEVTPLRVRADELLRELWEEPDLFEAISESRDQFEFAHASRAV